MRSRDPILVLVLTGVVVGALLGAGVGLVKYLADPYNQLPAMTFWLLGSLSAANVSDLLPLFGPVAVGTAVLVALRWRMNVMSLPEEEARSLGVATGPLRIAIVAAATLTTSASVATAGIIGWVGLVVPHLARSLVGPDFARLLPTAAILGGGYLLVIDTLARTAAEVEEPARHFHFLGDFAHAGEIDVGLDARVAQDADRGLRDVDGLIADALEIVVDAGDRQDQAKIDSHQLVQGQELDHAVVDFELKFVDGVFFVEDALGELLVGVEDGVNGLVDGAFGEAAHPEQALFQFVQIFFEMAFHLVPRFKSNS